MSVGARITLGATDGNGLAIVAQATRHNALTAARVAVRRALAAGVSLEAITRDLAPTAKASHSLGIRNLTEQEVHRLAAGLRAWSERRAPVVR